MKASGQFQKKPIAPSAPIPLSTGLFGARPFPKPSATTEDAVATKPDLQARLDFARRSAPNLQRLAANSSRDRATLAIQPKLTVGAPNDQYEQEADRVADQVMSMPDAATPAPIQREAAPEAEELQTKPLAAAITPLVQREMAPEEEEVQAKLAPDLQREEMPEEEEIQTKPIGSIQREAMPEEEEVQTKLLGGSIQREAMPEEEELQAKPLGHGTLQREAMPEEEEPIQTKQSPTPNPQPPTPSLESRLSSSQGGGSPLPEEVRTFMEPRFGADFSQVRVHTDSEAVQMNRDLNAQAFTHKQGVYFGAGKTPGKDALTAHELTHVVQQTGRLQTELTPQQETLNTVPKATKSGEDYVFIMGKDKFYDAATNFFGSADHLIKDIRSLEGIFNYLRALKTPVGRLIIVSHGSQDGTLSFKMRENDKKTEITFADLHEAVSNPMNHTLFELPPNIINDNTSIEIKGCNIGRSKKLLNDVDRAFGGHGTVSAPTNRIRYYTDRKGNALDSFETYYIQKPGARVKLSRPEQLTEFMNQYPHLSPEMWEKLLPRPGASHKVRKTKPHFVFYEIPRGKRIDELDTSTVQKDEDILKTAKEKSENPDIYDWKIVKRIGTENKKPALIIEAIGEKTEYYLNKTITDNNKNSIRPHQSENNPEFFGYSQFP